jgi:predicted acetyltransferase
MGDITIRSIEADELEAFLRATGRAFHGRWHDEDLEIERPLSEPDRSFVAVDGTEFVGTAAACTTELTVPGGRLPAPGVTAVGVLPSHRRRGINTRLMGTLLDQAAERGEPLAYLWASEAAIYGRFGYGAATWCTDVEAVADRARFVPDVRVEGTVRAVTRERALPLMRPVYDAVAAERPGFVPVDDRWWEALWVERKRDEDEPRFYAVHEDADGLVDGYAVYTVKHEWVHSVPANELHLRDLIARNPSASAALWRYLFDVDLIETVKAWDRPVDDDVRWLVTEPRRLQLRVADGLWVRLVDVARSLTGRRFPVDGRLVLEIEDAFRPATSGRYELVVDAGEPSCGRTDAEPDLTCSVGALAAAYLGGNSFSQLRGTHQVFARDREALHLADAMFAWAPSPWFGFIY